MSDSTVKRYMCKVTPDITYQQIQTAFTKAGFTSANIGYPVPTHVCTTHVEEAPNADAWENISYPELIAMAKE